MSRLWLTALLGIFVLSPEALAKPPKGRHRPAPAAAPAVAPTPPAAVAVTTPAPPAPTPSTPPPASGPSWGGPKSATATAEKTQVRLGEPFFVTIDVRHAKGEKWSIRPGEHFEPFELRSQQEVKTDDPELTRLKVELALFQLGPHAVPDFDLLAQTPGEPPHDLKLPGPMVKGIDELGKDRERRDIKGPVPLEVTTFRPLLYLLGAIVAGALIWLGIRAWRRRPKRTLAELAPRIPDDQIALTALTTLEAEGLPAGGHFKEFHLRLSEILRRYLSARYGIFALDMTSEELYRILAHLPSEGLVLADLEWVCAQGDLAKFAKAAPTVDDCKQALQMVRQLVQRTRRRDIEDALARPPRGVAA
jgi:hypothetical protein